MIRSWQLAYRRSTRAAFLVACVMLHPHCLMAEMTSGDTTSVPPNADVRGNRIVAQILGNLDREIAADTASTQGDAISQTVVHLIQALENSPRSREQLALAISQHLTERGRDAAAAGRAAEAERFVRLGGILKDLLDVTQIPAGADPVGPSADGNFPTASKLLSVAPAKPNSDQNEPKQAPADQTDAASPMISNSSASAAPAPDRPVGGDGRAGQQTGWADQPGSPTVGELIAQLDKQIADETLAPDQNATVSNTLADLFARLPGARPEEVQQLLALPPHLAEQGRQARLEGHPDEANRFEMAGDIIRDLFTTLNDAVAQQGSKEVAGNTKPASEPAKDFPGAGAAVRDSATDVGSETGSAPLATENAANRPFAERSGEQLPLAPSITMLLTKLDEQITLDDPTADPGKGPNTIISDILMWLRNAPSSDPHLVSLIAAHFSDRAKEAEATGRQAVADRFMKMNGLLFDLFSNLPPSAGIAPQDQASMAPRPLSYASAFAANTSYGRDAGPDTTVQPKTREAAGSTMEGLTDGPATIGRHMSSGIDPIGPPRTEGATDATPPFEKRLLPPEPTAPKARAKSVAVAAKVAPPRPKKAIVTAAIGAQCRAIALKFAIGEEPSDAERDYLRHGCRPHG